MNVNMYDGRSKAMEKAIVPIGRGVGFINFLAGNTLNRLSWKRSDAHFMNDCAENNSLWILFNKGQPLIKKSSKDASTGLAYLTTKQVQSLIGSLPYFGQGQVLGEPADSEPKGLEAARIWGPRIAFLGTSIPEGTSARIVRDMVESGESRKYISYFTFDVDGQPDPNSLLHLGLSVLSEERLEFSEPRSTASVLSAFDASLFAEARSIIDWNFRNKFCPGCGEPSFSVWAGWKLACSTLLPWNATGLTKNPCPSTNGLQNFMHPRTDAVVIVAVLSLSGEEILLGRNSLEKVSETYARGNQISQLSFLILTLLDMYSTLAGFLEPGETVEEAVKREVMEEAGVNIKDVQYHSSQPWPYPANLMIGCYAFAEDETIQHLDDELEDARFFSKEEVRKALKEPKLEGVVQVGSAGFRVPPKSAIAGVLITEWALGQIDIVTNLSNKTIAGRM